MNNNWDKQMQIDYDNMTKELGRTWTVYPRNDVLSYESQEAEHEVNLVGVPEVLFAQELDSENEMVDSGQMAVGDIRITFLSNTTAIEEGYISPDSGTTKYKILRLTKVQNQQNNIIMYCKGFGRKLPNR